jgi:RNA polymerase sigma factor (sigma-70 family)
VRAESGEEFSAFMAGRWPALVRFGYGLTGDPEAAGDLAREALARAWLAWPMVRRSADPESRVRRIMLAQVRGSRRSRFRSRLRTGENPELPEQRGPAGQRVPAGIPESAGYPEAARRRDLVAALGRLPARQRAVLTLRYWLGLSVGDTALALGWPARTVRRLDAAALARLGAEPEAMGGTPTGGPEPLGHELASRLRAAIDDLRPPPAPVAAVLRRGQALRRAWASVAAGSLVLVAVIGLASALSARPRHPAGRPRHSAPARIHPAVTIAAGTMRGQQWQLIVDAAAGIWCARVQEVSLACLGLAGYEHLTGLASLSGTVVPIAGSEPAVGPPQWNAVVGVVRSDVTSVLVTMSDGRTLRLRPVTAAGYRWVGLVYWPSAAQVVRASAYSSGNELGVVLPFIGSQTMPGTYYYNWLHQGLKGPAEQQRVIAAGGTGQAAWSASILAGPWGYCAVQQLPIARGMREACWSPPGLGIAAQLLTRTSAPGGTSTWLVGQARPQAAYLLLVMAGGGRVRIPVIEVSGRSFYALRLSRGQPVASWAAYDAAGPRLYGGRGAPS